MTTTGERIRSRRLSHGWTESDLARLVGVPPITVGWWEADSVRPSPSARRLIAFLFAVPMEELFPTSFNGGGQ